jgi:LysR family hydrogen peroxide-inducible transcriptional activator
MTLTQLEYIVALDTHRHFMLAADKCFVTQPTLSMQIQKLEDELGVKIFDRTRQPVIPTELGARIVAQARVALREAKVIAQLIADQQHGMSGELRVGIIPTLAPYVLPALFKLMRGKYPQLDLVVKEAITEEIVAELKQNRLDCGVVVTPLHDATIREDVLFYEELFVYVSKKNSLISKKYVLTDDIDPRQLWLLEEGHCFRSQVLNLCELRKRSDFNANYQTGSIETLKRLVDNSDGITILPELAVREFSKTQLKLVKRLKEPSPVREVSLVTHRDYLKRKLIQLLREEILSLVPAQMHKLHRKKVVEIGD